MKDTYNYLTIQADTRMPARQICMLQDTDRTAPFVEAVERAVKMILAEDTDVRVLHLGAGTGFPSPTYLWLKQATCRDIQMP